MDQEMLPAMERLLDRKLKPIEHRLGSLEADGKSIKGDTQYIREQVDVLYDWVDRIDLRVKALEK